MALNPLNQINLITIIALIALFVVTYFVLKRVFFNPYIEVMEKRSEKIADSHTRLLQALALKERAQNERERILAEAGEEAGRMTEEAKTEMAKEREAKVAQAQTEADKILAEKRAKVARLAESEQVKLKEDLFGCVNQTLTKLVGKVDQQALRSVVTKVLATGKVEK